MERVTVRIGPFTYEGRLETETAPKTCALVRTILPLQSQVVHVRWSGEGVWVPFGDNHFSLPYENATSHPAPGQFILYPGGASEAEILLAYGGLDFSSKVGQLAGNHFLSLTSGADTLQALGELVLWQGAQDIHISLAG